MLLICNAYGGTDEGDGADFVAVLVTPAFLEALKARQRLAQRLHREAAAGDLDSLLFHETSPQWLSWSEDLEELLHAAEATGWVLAEDDRIAIADTDEDPDVPHPVRTDCDFLQVWPERFQIVCCLRNSDTRLQSAMLYFDDFFTAAVRQAPAAQRRHAA
jgi:hypothetical protein